MNNEKENKPIFSPSLMCMDLTKMREQFEALNQHTELYHVDIMDGHFCPNITLSPHILKYFRRLTDKEIDVHLMTTDPTLWLEPVAQAGATYISPHAETINTHAFRTMNRIHSLGCKTGVVINPATPLSAVETYLSRVDLLTIMTIDVGFAGQPFIEEALDKIDQAIRLREKKGYSYKIQIDGSCSPRTFARLKKKNPDIYVVGNAGLFSLDEDLHSAWNKMETAWTQA